MESFDEILKEIPWDKLLILALGVAAIIGVFFLLMWGLVTILNKVQKKSRPHRIGIVMQVIIYACFLYALYRSAGTLVLAVFGEETTGFYSSVSYRKESDKAEPNQSFIQYEYYDFSVDGKAYKGGVFYMTDFPGVQSDSLDITYLPVLPAWNEPSKSVQFREIGVSGVLLNLGVIAGIIFLWILIARNNEPFSWRKKAHARWEKRQEKKEMAARKEIEDLQGEEEEFSSEGEEE